MGKLSEVRALAAEGVHFFLSRTFRDMHAEWDHLVTVVFPELREVVEQLGLEFFAVELRYLVPQMPKLICLWASNAILTNCGIPRPFRLDTSWPQEHTSAP